jgi:phosphatidylserine decarboxylase
MKASFSGDSARDNLEVLVKQIAGAVAKRIVNYLEVGQQVKQSVMRWDSSNSEAG